VFAANLGKETVTDFSHGDTIEFDGFSLKPPDLPVGVLERDHIAAGYSDPLGGHGWSAACHVPGSIRLAESTF
jgi:hypothetical protein